jgi:hypothetical protein
MSSFLDNEGNLVVDAILTDEGRKLLAEGAFNPTHYSFGDDDINYILYANTAKTPSTPIFQSPVFEAMTDNFAAQQHRLITYANNQPGYLYLPSLAMVTGEYGATDIATGDSSGFLVLLTTQAAVNKYAAIAGGIPAGFQDAQLDGQMANGALSKYGATFDTGFRTDEIKGIQRTDKINAELKNSAYMIQMDDKFLTLLIPGTGKQVAGQLSTALTAPSQGVDDDDIRSYLLTEKLNAAFFDTKLSINTLSPILGAFTGPRLKLRMVPSLLLRKASPWVSSLYPVQTLTNFFPDTTDALAIDTAVKITGMDTGITNTIYIRLIKET